MKINTFGEFYSFITNNTLDNLHPQLADFGYCVSQYNSLCACKKNAKLQRGDECTRQYINIINTVIPSLKEEVLSKTVDGVIEFYYNNNFFIGALSR